VCGCVWCSSCVRACVAWILIRSCAFRILGVCICVLPQSCVRSCVGSWVSAMRCWPSAELLLLLFAALLNCYCCCLLLQELRDSCNFVNVCTYCRITCLWHKTTAYYSLLYVQFAFRAPGRTLLPCTLKLHLSSLKQQFLQAVPHRSLSAQRFFEPCMHQISFNIS
jgi:hypothetical protein